LAGAHQRNDSGRSQPKPTLKIGVTLHPYYSWTKNIVGDLPGYEVRRSYPVRSTLATTSRGRTTSEARRSRCIVVNASATTISSGRCSRPPATRHIVIIRPNERRRRFTPRTHRRQLPHVISFTNAVQQTYAIQKALALLRPQDAAALQRNAGDYARRLRVIKAGARSNWPRPSDTSRHRSRRLGYLLQEFGLRLPRRPAAHD